MNNDEAKSEKKKGEVYDILQATSRLLDLSLHTTKQAEEIRAILLGDVPKEAKDSESQPAAPGVLHTILDQLYAVERRLQEAKTANIDILQAVR